MLPRRKTNWVIGWKNMQMLLSGSFMPFELMLSFTDTGKNKTIRLMLQNWQCRFCNIPQRLIYRDLKSILPSID